MTTDNNQHDAQVEAAAAPSADNGKGSQGGLVRSNDAVIVLDDQTRLLPTDSLPNHRPITASDMEIVGTLDSAGHRPIMADTIQVVNTDTLPGHRPIVASMLPVSDLDVLPGHRPIADNDVVDPPTGVLMGYLD